jgi:hypothetical protein
MWNHRIMIYTYILCMMCYSIYYILDRGGYNTRGGNVIVIAVVVTVAVMSSQVPHMPRRCVGRPPCAHPSYRDGTSATSFDRPSSAVSPWRPS